MGKARTRSQQQLQGEPETAFPWISSRTLLVNAGGKFESAPFVKECPLLLGFVEFGQGHNLSPSYHDPLEIIFVVEGRGRFTVESKVYSVAPGDWVLIGPREFHLLEAVNARPVKVIYAYFPPSLVHAPGESPLDCGWLRPFYYRGPSFSHVIPAARVQRFPVLDWIRRIHCELESRGPDYPLAVRTYLNNILLEAAHQLRDDCVTVRSREYFRDFERLSAVFEFVDKHLGEEITLQQACRIAHMSPAYFCRFFKKVTNLTLTDYIQRKRVDQTQKLLLQTNLSITQIAYQAGFGSHAYFDRVFRRLTGLTPSAYRKGRRR